MTIKQILEMPIGQRLNPGTLTIKTAKKKWQVEEVWWQQVILMDETGEMPADVKIGGFYPLNGIGEIKIIVAEVQEAEYLGKNRKKLVVDQFSRITQTVDEFQSKQDEIDKDVKLIVESKVRCWLVSAFIEGYTQKFGYMPPPEDVDTKKKILEWQEFVLTGE